MTKAKRNPVKTKKDYQQILADRIEEGKNKPWNPKQMLRFFYVYVNVSDDPSKIKNEWQLGYAIKGLPNTYQIIGGYVIELKDESMSANAIPLLTAEEQLINFDKISWIKLISSNEWTLCGELKIENKPMLRVLSSGKLIQCSKYPKLERSPVAFPIKVFKRTKS